MSYQYLTDAQGARAEALHTAHRLICGTISVSREGLLEEDQLSAVRLAEYVLTGKYVLPPSAAASSVDPIAGATGSTEAGYL